MNGTPRLRSEFPPSPPARYGTNSNGQRVGSGHQGSTQESLRSSLIPEGVIDYGSQRLYAIALYGALSAWRFYECYLVWLSDDASTPAWTFSKFAILDALFVWGLPKLHIPMLRWSARSAILIYGIHLVLTAWLMFQPLVSAVSTRNELPLVVRLTDVQ